MEKAREKFADLSEQGRNPADYAIEVPCFPGWNLVSKTKAKDIKIIPEPYSSFTATSRTPVLYYKNEERIENIELTRSLIDSLPTKHESEIEINKRLKDQKILNPLPFDDEKVDNNLSIDEIRKKIFSKGHEQVKLRKAYLWKNVDVNKIIKYFGNYKCPRSHEWTCKMIAIQIKALNEFKKIKNWNIGIFSIKEGPKYPNITFAKNKIEVAIQQRSIYNNPSPNYFSIRTLSDPKAEFADMNEEEYNKGIESWLNLYKKTGKCVIKRRKISFLPAQFKQKIRQQRKGGLLIIYPWSTKFKENFNKEKDIYVGWQIITPPSRNEDDDDKLIYNVAMNQAAREHREAEYKEFFNPDLFL